MKNLIIKSLAILLLISFNTKGIAQTKITWEIMKDVKFVDKWSKEFESYYSVAQFGNNIKKYDGKEVIIRGYIIPVDIVQDYYVLSANPYASCFFCGQAGPESVLELQMKKNYKGLKMDQILTFKGKLRLNSDDVYQLYYILENAEIID
ncbi:MAG: DUF3299 domain-containing protein [Flavobacteriales bacterium]